ncbi:uncharacterized protein LOC119284280 [Triticum dicoccoides]|uniref:uncharacterized protein LOC119284280 n=1 Tax=Triticum dicoccoides TaxID=85692 RepID=UPI00188FD19B|nr:uncharacterized protein LOC119284280 [Triticum dicoccoides]
MRCSTGSLLPDLIQLRASMNAAWAVHIYNGGNGPYLLLHSAAYGRYLAAMATPARLGHCSLHALLRDYDQPGVEDIMCQAMGSGFANDIVLLRNIGGRYLRANGRYLRWNTAVNVDDNVSSMMFWVVEPMPAREDMSALLAPPPNTPYGYLLGVIHPEPGWLIRFVWALNEGHYPKDPEADGWQQFWFRGRSAFHLRDDLGFLVSSGMYYRNILL